MLRIAKLNRDRFAPSSERGRKLLDQLEPQLEETETVIAEHEAAATRSEPERTTVRPFTRAKPVRAPLPEHLGRRRGRFCRASVSSCRARRRAHAAAAG